MIQSDSYRDAWAEINASALAGNVKRLKAFVGASVQIMAVVKADGYGHGAVESAKAALRAGAQYLAVAIMDEALELRKSGVEAPILVLGYTPARAVKAAIAENITLAVYTDEVMDEIVRQAEHMDRTAVIHLKIDTGMSRNGALPGEETLRLAGKAAASPHVAAEGVFTHFADADGDDPAFTYAQFARFQAAIGELERHGHRFSLKHCCNSAAAMRFPEMHMDIVRIGLAMYGLYPSERLKTHAVRLEPAFSLKANIAFIKNVDKHQPIGYGRSAHAERPTALAALPVGYGDGYSRLLSNRGTVSVRGIAVPIIGRVSMDVTLVDVTAITGCKPGEEAVLIGGSDIRALSVDDVAQLMGTINYEVTCLIGKRIPRIYV